MTTAAAIVNWNSGPWLRACIQSVMATSPDTELVVVDNGSTDDSIEQAAIYRDSVNFIHNSTNRGLAAAMNQAFAATSTACVLMLNPDVHVTGGAIARLEQIMDTHKRAAAVGGYVNEKYLPRELPNTFALIRENLGVGTKPQSQGLSEKPVRVQQPAAAALLIRRDAYDQIGGFDEQFYPAWYEDVDLCHRLIAAGWEIYFARDAEFLHEGGYSARALGPQGFSQAYYRNQMRYAQKHFGSAKAATVRLSIAAGMIGRMAVHPRNARACWNTLVGALGQW